MAFFLNETNKENLLVLLLPPNVYNERKTKEKALDCSFSIMVCQQQMIFFGSCVLILMLLSLTAFVFYQLQFIPVVVLHLLSHSLFHHIFYHCLISSINVCLCVGAAVKSMSSTVLLSSFVRIETSFLKNWRTNAISFKTIPASSHNLFAFLFPHQQPQHKKRGKVKTYIYFILFFLLYAVFLEKDEQRQRKGKKIIEK